MKTIFYDTESIGFFSPTVLIQYTIEDGGGRFNLQKIKIN